MSNKFYEATKTPDHQEASLWYCGLLVSGTFGHFSSFLNRCERYEYLPVEFSDKKPSLLHGLCELNSSQNLTTSLVIVPHTNFEETICLKTLIRIFMF